MTTSLRSDLLEGIRRANADLLEQWPVEPPFAWRVLDDTRIPLLVEVHTDGASTILSIEEDMAIVLSGPELNECDLGELMADVARYEAGRATRYGEDVSPMQWERARVMVARLEAERAKGWV